MATAEQARLTSPMVQHAWREVVGYVLKAPRPLPAKLSEAFRLLVDAALDRYADNCRAEGLHNPEGTQDALARLQTALADVLRLPVACRYLNAGLQEPALYTRADPSRNLDGLKRVDGKQLAGALQAAAGRAMELHKPSVRRGRKRNTPRLALLVTLCEQLRNGGYRPTYTPGGKLAMYAAAVDRYAAARQEEKPPAPGRDQTRLLRAAVEFHRKRLARRT